MIARIGKLIGRGPRLLFGPIVRKLGLKSPLVATLCYLRNRDFQLEAWSYLHGLNQARSDESSSTGWRYHLRTNIHILEKGLSASSRRQIFGAKIAGLAVAAFARLHALRATCATAQDEPLYLWARDVLTKYFEVVGSDPKIDAARSAFRKLALNCPQGWPQLSPYNRGPAAADLPTYEQLLVLARRRRSVRTYRADPVPRELIDRAMVIASLAPSSCNRQPFHYRVCDDQKLISLLEHVPGGITCFNCVPMLIVITGDMRGCIESITNRHAIYVDASLSVMAFQLALETMGLSSCCVHWSETREKDRAVQAALGMQPFERVVMFMVVGYPEPDAIVPRSQKRHLDELRSYNAIGTVT